MTGGDSLPFDPDFLVDIEGRGNRRPNFSKSVLVAEDRSITDGSVGKVSREPLVVPDERSEEAPVDRPREESEAVSVSRGTEEPEGRFAIGCAIPAVDMSCGGSTAVSGAVVGAENVRLR